MSNKKKNLVKKYRGDVAKARERYLKDAEKKLEEGYYPTSESYIEGKYGTGAFIIALLLCFLVIGILIFIYMLIIKPEGALVVTYELREIEQEMPCPKCAEKIRAEAKLCRHCGFDIENAQSSI